VCVCVCVHSEAGAFQPAELGVGKAPEVLADSVGRAQSSLGTQHLSQGCPWATSQVLASPWPPVGWRTCWLGLKMEFPFQGPSVHSSFILWRGKLRPREVMSPAHSTLVRRLGLDGFQGSGVPGRRPSPAPMCCHLPPGVQAQRGAAGAARAAGAQQRWALAARRQIEGQRRDVQLVPARLHAEAGAASMRPGAKTPLVAPEPRSWCDRTDPQTRTWGQHAWRARPTRR